MEGALLPGDFCGSFGTQAGFFILPDTFNMCHPSLSRCLAALACHISAYGMMFFLVQGKWLSFTVCSDPGIFPGKMALIQSATVVWLQLKRLL
jgi:hypothetical protein